MAKGGVFQGKLQSFVTLDNPVIWYWFGFIYADGHLSDNHLIVSVQKSDENHLSRISEIINCNIRVDSKMCHFTLYDQINAPLLKRKLGINLSNKTENPPDFKEVFKNRSESFLPMLIGYIDGDGSISTKNKRFQNLRIRVHGSWINNLSYIKSRLKLDYNIESTVSIDKRGYANLIMCKLESILKLKNLAIEHNLPFMKRKWNSFIEHSRNKTIYELHEDEIIQLKLKGDKLIEISKKLNIKYGVLKINTHKIKQKCIQLQQEKQLTSLNQGS